MNSKTLFTLASLLVLLSFGATAVHSEPDESSEPYTEIVIPQGLSEEGVQSAIIKAAIGRRWNIIKKEADHTVINLTHRGYDSTLTFTIKDSNIHVHSDSWAVDKKGEKKKKKDPTGWIENLRKDIIVFMNRELYG
ncbi:hypothetical protein [Pelagicoccus sp. SDUM812002]|uniref:hypothetical protein n=1 Tax=Pelagicoccus sp. SDUM812002 TaxID=3041266 RepID=UPI00280D0069|nr:hypothetical protein [Pelagicoccus sp. SDUM812002]MDQ8186372.1 hypothetical protein [Pelagicoccus sp. SDUM812002]